MLREASAARDLRPIQSSDLGPRSLVYQAWMPRSYTVQGAGCRPNPRAAFTWRSWPLRGMFMPAHDNYVIRTMRHQVGIDGIIEGGSITNRLPQGPFKQCAPSRRMCARAALNTRCST
jgi:hypothetical protein